MRFYAFGSAAKPGAGNSSKIVKHWAVQFGTHNRLFIDEVQPCEGLERAIDCIQDTRFSPPPSSLPQRQDKTCLQCRIVRSCMQYQPLNEGSVVYACSGAEPSGGGVSPRNTRLRGQSIIEYVLIAAIIGLVVIIAGPQVSGAIRNQFSQVANTVDSGTDGDSFMSAEEKAYREAMKNVAQKDAKDWTLDEQKAAAADIAKNGTSSVVYAKAKAAMDAGTTWSIKLTNGQTLQYRIVGINHDDLADGSGKAGLTFEATNTALAFQKMNATYTNVGGWEKSELRGRLNTGDLWSLLPTEL